MPSCFQLIPKGSDEPSKMVDIDAAICEHLGIEFSTEFWALGWYNSIGLGLAMGRNWDELKDILISDPELVKVIDFLQERYNVSAWYER